MRLTSEEEGGLVDRSLKGDSRAYHRLASPLRKVLFYKSLRATKCPEAAEDIAQRAFINAFFKLHTFRREARFSTWFYTIGTNCIRMWARTRSRRPDEVCFDEVWESLEGFSTGNFPEEKNPEQMVSLEEHRKLIRDSIAELPEMYRQVAQHQIVEDLTLREIHHVTGLSIPTIKTRLFRSKDKIRGMLEAV